MKQWDKVMENYNKTMPYRHTTSQQKGQVVTIFDAGSSPYSISLSDARKSTITFGRGNDNDIMLFSPLVSRKHGRFVLIDGRWRIEDLDSRNGIIYNNANIRRKEINDGDFFRIDDGVETVADGVLFVFSSSESANQWGTLPISRLNKITVGRDMECSIVLPHISVSKCHVKIIKGTNGYYIVDNNSTNGVLVNGKRIVKKERLHEKDIITITNSKLIFTSYAIFYCCFQSGVSVDASNILIKRGKGKKAFITCNHVNLNIKAGELVAVIGASGAGKSTILNCLCGYLKPSQGEVYVNGVNLYQNFDSLKRIIGYVPQSDIVYDNLTLYDMLLYTAKLRLPSDTRREERENIITRAIEMVELQEKKNSMIKSLSGGQRKRASIAVELLSDPNLLFLDEPASGLDPHTERNLMQSLRGMADNGKTVILVTHSVLQLKLCDKIIFMGKGGNLCFYGSYDEALHFFSVSDVVDIYHMITEQAQNWREKYAKINAAPAVRHISSNIASHQKENVWKQLFVLCARYQKLVVNDRQRLFLLLIQAPVLAILISFVANGKQFEQYEITKSLLFALSCSAFWIGMLNAIQEICKEKIILKREYMTGLSLSAYIASKIIVLGGLGLFQSLIVAGVFAKLIGVPEVGVILHPFAELFLTTFLTAIASSAMGLFVSSFFTNADRAMTVAPILLMPQILFSGLIFKLDGATEMISWFAVCRWSMEGYGTTANLNNLPLRLQQEGIAIPHESETFFEFTSSHIIMAWGILIVFTLIVLMTARSILIGKERA